MKKVINSLFVIIAAMVTFAGCQKEENNAPATPETKTVQFFANSIETKTHFGDKTADNKYPTLWDAGDKVKVLMNLENVSGVSKLEATSQAIATSDIFNDGTSARFKVELNSDYQTTAYTYYAVAPSTAYNAKSADDGRLTVIIPSNQTPTASGLDKAAQIIYAVSDTYPSIQDAIALDFKHFTAYGKFSLINLTNQIGTIASVSLEFVGVNVAGKWNYYPATDTKGEQDGSNKITLTTSSATNLWFACAPADVSDKTMKVTVTDVKGKQLVKEIRMPAKRVFESGKVSSFTVDMSGIVPPVQETTKCYKKVTESQSDWTGTYLIVYEDGAKAYVFNATDAANGYLSATISDGTIASTSETDAVQVQIESMNGGYAIKSSKGYIYGKSNDNKLNFNSTTQQLNEIEYESTGVKIVSLTSVLRFNSTSGQMRFRYYKSSSYSSQKPVQLYKLVDGESGGETPEPEQPTLSPRNLAFSSTTATATVGQPFTAPTLNGETAGVTYSSSNTGVATVNETTGVVTLVGAGTTTITATGLATDQYEADEASYTLTVSAAQGGSGEVVTETISGTFTSANSKLTLTTASGITIVQEIVSGSTAVNATYNTATTLRVYKGHALKFSGKTITKIEFTHTSGYKGNTVTASTGKYTSGNTSSVWEGESDNITITNTATNSNVQLRPTKIVVTYKN